MLESLICGRLNGRQHTHLEQGGLRQKSSEHYYDVEFPVIHMSSLDERGGISHYATSMIPLYCTHSLSADTLHTPQCESTNNHDVSQDISEYSSVPEGEKDSIASGDLPPQSSRAMV